MKYAVIVCEGRTLQWPAAEGATVAEVISSAGILLKTACGGRGLCRRCLVFLGEGEYAEVGGQTFRLGAAEEREVLACRVRPLSRWFHVRIPPISIIETDVRIQEDYVLPPGSHVPRARRVCLPIPPVSNETTSDYERLYAALTSAGYDEPYPVSLTLLRQLSATIGREGGHLTVTLFDRTPVAVERGACTDAPCPVIAADIGTTTVVVVLVDARNGQVLARASRYNQQIRKADDVASRISWCRGPEEVDWMRRLVVEETLNPLIHEVCAAAGFDPKRLLRVSAAGNTVMTHLLLGLSPAGIGVLPFTPVIRAPQPLPAQSVGLDVGPEAWLEVAPCISGYVGGDIVADLHVARLLEGPGPALLLDIGTNGEMALWKDGRLWVAATAAGPAFEGAGVRHGCRAAAGAIEHFRWREDGTPEYRVIGPRRPIGLCGSALIDFLSESRRAGFLNETGRFEVERLNAAGRHWEIPSPRGPLHACLIVPPSDSGIEGPIYVTEADVAELLKAKAAIRAGIETLLSVTQCPLETVRELVLAGGFARHIDIEHAIHIGLLPPLPQERIRVIGNGSLAGAVLKLLDSGADAAFARIIEVAEPVELNLVPSFADHFADAMLLPDGG